VSTYFEEPRLRPPAKADAWRTAYVSRVLGRPREALAARPVVVSRTPERDQGKASTSVATEPQPDAPERESEELLTRPITPAGLSTAEPGAESSRQSPDELENARPSDPVGKALSETPDAEINDAAPGVSIPEPGKSPSVDDKEPTVDTPQATTSAPPAPRRTWKQRLMSGLRWFKSLLFDDAGRSPEGQARQRTGLMAMSGAGLVVPAPAIPPAPAPAGESPAKKPQSPVSRMAEIYVDRNETGNGAKRAESLAEGLKSADHTFFNTNAGRFAAGAAAGAAHTQANLLYGASHVMHGAEIAARASAQHMSGRPELREVARDRNVERMDQMHLNVAALKANRPMPETEEDAQIARERVLQGEKPVREYPENPDETALAEFMSLQGEEYPGSQRRVDDQALAHRQRSIRNYSDKFGRTAFYSTVRAVTQNLKLGGATLRTGGDLVPEWPMSHTVGDKVPRALAQQALSTGGSLDPSLRKPADDPQDSTALPRRLARYLDGPGPDLRPAGTDAPLVDAELSRMKQLRKTVEYWTDKQLSGAALSREQVSAMEAMRAEASSIYGRAQQQSDLLSAHKGDPVRTVGHGAGTEFRAGGLTAEGGTEDQTSTTVGGALAQGLRAGGHATRTVGTIVEGRPEEGRKFIDNGQLGLAALTTAAGLGLQGIEAAGTITGHTQGALMASNAIQYTGKTTKLGGMLAEAAGDNLASAPGGQDQRDMQQELDSGKRSAQVRTEPVNWTGEGREKRPADMTKPEAVRRAAEAVEAGLDTGLIPGMGVSTGGVLPVNSWAPTTQFKRNVGTAGMLGINPLGTGGPDFTQAVSSGVDLATYQQTREFDNKFRDDLQSRANASLAPSSKAPAPVPALQNVIDTMVEEAARGGVLVPVLPYSSDSP